MKRILIVEDDKALSTGIIMALKNEEVDCTPCYTWKDAREKIGAQDMDLVLLDINLPDGSGLKLLQMIREKGNTPVILLTANDLETDIVTGLSMGADDYVTKPFSLAVLRARTWVQLRRQKGEECYHLGPYDFDFAAHIFKKEGNRVELSKTEEKILKILVQNKGGAVPRERIQSSVWNEGFEYVEENALSVAVNRLRGKLDAKDRIKTVYGIGYLWEVEE